MNNIGKRIKELRKKKDLTQEKLADMLGITYKAVSKWECGLTAPDISMIVPLASILEVSTDTLFGLTETTDTEDVWNIVINADSVKVYRNLETYLKAYSILMDGLKKYPGNLIIMNNCMNLGVSLSLPENGWIYAGDKAKDIAIETISQAKFIIANSKNNADILNARKSLVFLYCSLEEYDLATNEARNFPVRPDFTLYSNMAIVNEYMQNYNRAQSYLCSSIDYTLQAIEDDIARLGKAYYNDGKYDEAICVYETFFSIIDTIFKNECPQNYHDFDSGDCYRLLAKAYIATGNNQKAMDAVEKSVMYYIDLYNDTDDENISWVGRINTPLLKYTEAYTVFPKSIIKEKLSAKLACEDIQVLKEESRFIELQSIVDSL